MDFQTAIRTCLNKYTEFQGRAQRSEYWWFALFGLLLQVAGTVIDLVIGSEAGMVALVAGLVILLPSISVMVRRLHDQDRTGWWGLLLLVPFIGSIILIVLMILEGTKGPNRFGPDPLDPQEEEIQYSASNIPTVQDDD